MEKLVKLYPILLLFNIASLILALLDKVELNIGPGILGLVIVYFLVITISVFIYIAYKAFQKKILVHLFALTNLALVLYSVYLVLAY